MAEKTPGAREVSSPFPMGDDLPEKSVKRRKAVAIRYRSEESQAPVVIAKGSGAVADRIMEIAEKNDIPLYCDPDLVTVLSGIDLGTMIPPELYQAVAEVLAFVYRMNGKFSEAGKVGKK